MNWFRYLCPSCGGMYNDTVEGGRTKLLHRGLKSSTDKRELPTTKCIPYHDYVLFEPCGHCCPEIFAECRACKLGYPGKLDRPSHPSNQDCFCHYCIESDSARLLDKEGVKNLLDDKAKNREFDVFLSYNSEDKDHVKNIGLRLRDEGLLPWLDDWEIRPGEPWQRALEENINSVKSAAVFYGASGVGPWQKMEVEAFLQNFIKRGCPVIPVLLSEYNKTYSLPIFLQAFHSVDFTQPIPDPLKQLIWGITGKKLP